MPLINFSGLASGIDSEALIEATSAATRQQRVEPLEEDISQLEDETDGLNELKTMLGELRDIIFQYSTLNGGVVAKQALSSDESILSAIASDSAAKGSYSITVEQLAKSATFSFDDRFSSLEDPISPDGDPNQFLFFTVGGDTVTVEMDPTTTPSQFVASFNNATDKATASLINVGSVSSPSYAIVINTTSVGTELGSITYDAGTGLGAGVFAAHQLDQALDSVFSVSGIAGTITRQSNTVNDVIEGVTLSLESASPGSPVQLTINTDAASTQSNIEEFIEKYNEIVTFLSENNTVTREEEGATVENIFAALARTSLDDNILTSLRQALSGSVYEDGTHVRIFADIGIVTERDGTLRFNKTTADNNVANFDKAIAADPDAINLIFQAFADTTATTSGTINQYIRFNGLIDLSVNSSRERISDLNDRIARAEEAILRTEQSLRARFARLESISSQMQGAQQALTSALAGLNGGS